MAGLPSAQVHHSAAGPMGTIYLATPAGLVVYDGVTCRNMTTAQGLVSDGLRVVSTDSAGRAWVGSDLGIDLIDADSRVHSLDREEQPGLVSCCLADDTGAWIACASGLLRAEFSERIKLSSVDPGSIHPVLVLSRDGRGNPVACNAMNQLHRWDGIQWSLFKYDSYTIVGTITVITADSADSLLVAALPVYAEFVVMEICWPSYVHRNSVLKFPLC